VLSPTAWLPSKLYEIEEKGKELSNVYSLNGSCSHVWHNGANSCSMQYSMQWELHQILRESICYVSKLYQNCYKHCYNCETIDI
jgi:hypothetical protein